MRAWFKLFCQVRKGAASNKVAEKIMVAPTATHRLFPRSLSSIQSAATSVAAIVGAAIVSAVDGSRWVEKANVAEKNKTISNHDTIAATILRPILIQETCRTNPVYKRKPAIPAKITGLRENG